MNLQCRFTNDLIIISLQLKFDGVEVTELRVVTPADSRLGISQLENEFVTFTEVNKLNLTYGIDVLSGGPVYVRFPHLQHKDFTYEIKVIWKTVNSEQRSCMKYIINAYAFGCRSKTQEPREWVPFESYLLLLWMKLENHSG